METYKGDNTLAKQIEQSRVTLSMTAKMLEKMRENQKRYYKNRKYFQGRGLSTLPEAQQRET